MLFKYVHNVMDGANKIQCASLFFPRGIGYFPLNNVTFWKWFQNQSEIYLKSWWNETDTVSIKKHEAGTIIILVSDFLQSSSLNVKYGTVFN